MAEPKRQAVKSVAARRRARELAAAFEARQKALLDGAEEFLAIQQEVNVAVDGIGTAIAKLEERGRQAERDGWERQAQVVARMRKIGAREDEVAARLGIGLGEVRRMIAHGKSAKDSAAAAGSGGQNAKAGAGGGPVAHGGGGPVEAQEPGVPGRGAAAGPAVGSVAGAQPGAVGPGGGLVVPSRLSVAPNAGGVSGGRTDRPGGERGGAGR